MPGSLDAVTIAASDFARSLAFYDVALEALGLVRAAEFGDEEEEEAEVEAAAWGTDSGAPFLWLVHDATSTHGVHVRLRAESRDAVEAFFAAAVAAGGVAQVAPRRWVIYRRGEFSAAVMDPEGNTVEAMAAE